MLVGNFNINVLDFENNEKVENFLNQMFPHNMIPKINKPTRVIRNTATAINHFITSTVVNIQKSGIIQTDFRINFLLYLPFKQKRAWLKNIINILFIRDIMMKNQQTYSRIFQLYIRKFFFQKRELE